MVRRADGSGTSFVFTSYLSKVNEEWKSKIGAGSTVNWPTGLGGKGNDGIAAFVQRLPGSIGYVEYAYAKQNNLAYTKLVSADGKPVSPTEDNFANAAKGVDWIKSFAQDLTCLLYTSNVSPPPKPVLSPPYRRYTYRRMT